MIVSKFKYPSSVENVGISFARSKSPSRHDPVALFKWTLGISFFKYYWLIQWG